MSKLQKTREQPFANDGSLNLVDMIHYLRAQVMRNHGQPSAAPAQPQAQQDEPVNAR